MEGGLQNQLYGHAVQKELPDVDASNFACHHPRDCFIYYHGAQRQAKYEGGVSESLFHLRGAALCAWYIALDYTCSRPMNVVWPVWPVSANYCTQTCQCRCACCYLSFLMLLELSETN